MKNKRLSSYPTPTFDRLSQIRENIMIYSIDLVIWLLMLDIYIHIINKTDKVSSMQLPTNQKYIINSIKLSSNSLLDTHNNHSSHISHSAGRICYDDTENFGSSFAPYDKSSFDQQPLQADNKVYLRIDSQNDSFSRGNELRYWNLLPMAEIIGRKIKQHKKIAFSNMGGMHLQQEEQKEKDIQKELKIIDGQNIITCKQKQSQKIMQKYAMNRKRASEMDYHQIDGQYASYLTKITENDEQNSQCFEKYGLRDENDLISESFNDKDKRINITNLNKHRSCQHFSSLIEQRSTNQQKDPLTSITKSIKKPKSRQETTCILPKLIKIQRSNKIKTNLNEQIFNLLATSCSENMPKQLISLPSEHELKVDLCDMLNIVQMANYPPPSNLSLSFNLNNNATNFTSPNTPRSSINHSIAYSSAKKNNSSMLSSSQQKDNQQSSSLLKSIHVSSACRQQKKCIPLSSNYRQYQKEKLNNDQEKQIGQQLKIMRRYTLSHQNSPHKQYHTYKNFNGFSKQFESSTYVSHQNQKISLTVGKRKGEENGKKCQGVNYEFNCGAQAINFKNSLIQQRQMNDKNMDNINPNYREYLRINKDVITNNNSDASMGKIEKQKKTERKSTPVNYYNSICRPSINVDTTKNRNVNEGEPGQTNRKTIIISKNRNSAAQHTNFNSNMVNRSYQTINPAPSISMTHYNTQNSYTNQAQIKPYSHQSQNRASIQAPYSYVTLHPLKQQPPITQSYRNSSKSASKISMGIDINKLAKKYLKTNTNKSKYQQSQQYLYNGQYQFQDNQRRQKYQQSSYENEKIIFPKKKHVEGSFNGQQISSISLNNYRNSVSKNQPMDTYSITMKTTKNDSINAILNKYSRILGKEDQPITNPATAEKTVEQANSTNKQASISSQIKQSLASTNFKTSNNQIFQQAYMNGNQNIYKNGYPYNKLKSNSFTCNSCQYSQEQQNRNEYILQISKMRKQRQKYYKNTTNFSQGNNPSLQTYKEQRKSEKTININRLNHTTLNIYTPNSSNKQRLSLSISQNPNHQQYSGPNTDYKKTQSNNKNSNLNLSAFEKDYIESKNLQKMQSVENNLREKNLEYIYNKSRSIAFDKQKEKDKNKKERQIFYTNLRNKDKLIEKEKQKEKNKGRDKNYASLIQNYEENSYKKYIKNEYLPMNSNNPNMSRLL